MKSIRSKILLAIILTVSISLAILGTVAVYLNIASTNSTLKATMSQTAVVAAERVAQEIQAYKNIATETGSTASLADATVSNAEKEAIIQQKVATYNFNRGQLIGRNGICIANGIDYSDRDYFKKAIQGETSVTEPMIAKSTGTLSVMVAAPVWRDGTPGTSVEGVVFFVPQETFLNDIVASVQVSANGSSYIINRSGDTIAHRNIDNVKNKENTMKDAQTDTGLAGLAAMEKAMTEGQSGFGTYTYGGTKKFLAYAPVPETDGWSIGINAPTKDFMYETEISVYITIALFIISVLASIAIARAVAGKISTPIRQCANRLGLLVQGDLTSPVPTTTAKDETGMLLSYLDKTVVSMREMIGDVSFHLGEMAAGNLTHTITKEYNGDFTKLGNSVAEILKGLSGMLKKINRASDEVSSGSEQVSSGAQALSQGATEQASSVEELAAAITEISEHVQVNAQNARKASSQAEKASDTVVESNEKMERMISAISVISGKSGEIAKIIKAIEDIAFQTNILALNAAVEAARAGSAGKGFAVVADEVRNLAGKSAEAAKNTTRLIEENVKAVDNGTSIAHETAESLASVMGDTKQVSALIEQIMRASDEQASSLAQVSSGVDQISSVVQTNSATAEQSAAASEELSSQAMLLKELVSTFQFEKDDSSSGQPRLAGGASAPTHRAAIAPRSASSALLSSADRY